MNATAPTHAVVEPAPGGPQPRRLKSGGLIDRSRPLRAQFDDRELTGFAGDTLASALLAAGDPLVARSFKYHRPRGIFAAGSEEPNALVELRSGARREPNTKATAIELYEGLEARSQNRWPSLRFDVLALSSWLGPLFAAGFYYKTFMWPASFWERVYEPLIRHAAGLGRAAGRSDPDLYEQTYAFCDVLIIGAGPGGLAAALAAARSGARVIVCDEDFRFGGRLLADRREIGVGESAGMQDRAVRRHQPEAGIRRADIADQPNRIRTRHYRADPAAVSAAMKPSRQALMSLRRSVAIIAAQRSRRSSTGICRPCQIASAIASRS